MVSILFQRISLSSEIYHILYTKEVNLIIEDFNVTIF